MNDKLSKISFQYAAKTADAKAALNFHLTQREKINILQALDNEDNAKSFAAFSASLLQAKDTAAAK